MKYIFIILVSLSFSTMMNAQDTTVVCINNINIAQTIIKPDLAKAIIQLNKTNIKNASSFIIKVYGENIGSIHKRELEITGDSNIIITEIKGKPGYFDLSKSNIKKRLLAGKSISLYLLMNPPNSMMLMPTKRIYLGNLVMK
jgi:hypothetical protein